MELEAITRQEQIIAGEDLQPVTRMEFFLKAYGGGGSGGGGEITTLHINVTAINRETMEATFTADKTPTEMQQALANGPTWCVVTFEAGTMFDSTKSVGIPPAWTNGVAAFGMKVHTMHNSDGDNNVSYAVNRKNGVSWVLDLTAFSP